MNDEYRPGTPHSDPGGPQSVTRVLRRSREDRVLGGVSGGLGRYFGVDPILIRLAWVALVLAGGTGILLYIICWIVIPEEKMGEYIGAAPATSPQSATALRYLVGGGLVLIGGMLLLRILLPWIGMQFIWALVLIAVGLIILVQGVRR
jgi:phage shock protein C